MNPLVALGVLGGLVYLTNRRRRTYQSNASASSGTSALGDPEDGFVITADCKHLLVTNPDRFKATMEKFYRDQKLTQLVPEDPVEKVPWAMTKNFFAKYAIHCPPGSFSVETPDSELPLNRRLMEMYVNMAVISIALQDGLLSADQATALSMAVAETLGQVSPLDWAEVFQNTVPIPEQGGPG